MFSCFTLISSVLDRQVQDYGCATKMDDGQLIMNHLFFSLKAFLLLKSSLYANGVILCLLILLHWRRHNLPMWTMWTANLSCYNEESGEIAFGLLAASLLNDTKKSVFDHLNKRWILLRKYFDNAAVFNEHNQSSSSRTTTHNLHISPNSEEVNALATHFTNQINAIRRSQFRFYRNPSSTGAFAYGPFQTEHIHTSRPTEILVKRVFSHNSTSLVTARVTQLKASWRQLYTARQIAIVMPSLAADIQSACVNNEPFPNFLFMPLSHPAAVRARAHGRPRSASAPPPRLFGNSNQSFQSPPAAPAQPSTGVAMHISPVPAARAAAPIQHHSNIRRPRPSLPAASLSLLQPPQQHIPSADSSRMNTQHSRRLPSSQSSARSASALNDEMKDVFSFDYIHNPPSSTPSLLRQYTSPSSQMNISSEAPVISRPSSSNAGKVYHKTMSQLIHIHIYSRSKFSSLFVFSK